MSVRLRAACWRSLPPSSDAATTAAVDQSKNNSPKRNRRRRGRGPDAARRSATLRSRDIDAALTHTHAVALQAQFMTAMANCVVGPFAAERLVVPLSEPARGNFLAFEHPEAAQWNRRLHAAGIVTDVRGTRLRLGFGLYHTSRDVERLVERLRRLA